MVIQEFYIEEVPKYIQYVMPPLTPCHKVGLRGLLYMYNVY